ncbi:MAG: hypothetical protein ABW044_10570, partial [Cellvibrio sp.]
MLKKQVSFRLHFLLALTVLVLQGCGGGGGGGGNSKSVVGSSTSTTTNASSLSSTSSSYTNSSSSSNSTQSTKLIISGLVVADALANANIELTIGTQQFSTKTNAQRQYSLEINVLPENQETPFIAKASGADNNNWIQFASLFPSVNKLKILAREDGVLDVNEYFGVNISASSTAEYVLASKNKRQIKTDDDRKWALFGVSTETQSEMAAMINIFLNDINFDLPKNTKTTLDFLLDANTSSAYINTLKINDPQYLNESRNSISSDPNQTKAPTETIQGTYLIQSTYVSYLLELNSDGTGRFQSGNMPSRQLSVQIE